MLTIPRLLCKTSGYIISTLHHGNSWSFVVAKTVEIGAIPAVSRGTHGKPAQGQNDRSSVSLSAIC